MPKKLTINQYKEKVYKIWENEFEVLSNNYTNANAKILVRHKCGHEYMVRPYSLLQGYGCPRCAGTQKKTAINLDMVLKKFKEYSCVGEYINWQTHIKIRHDKCGHEWDITPANFSKGYGCPKCANNIKKTTERYKKDIYDLVGNSYEVLGEYTSAKAKIKMKHNDCGYEWEVEASSFLSGRRCPICSDKRRKLNAAKGLTKFKEQVVQLVGDEYEVKGKYKNDKTKITLVHRKCGFIWETTPGNFLRGNRCPDCNKPSKGEERIKDFLQKGGISFKTQVRFKECKDKRQLPFDFAVFDKDENIKYLIEYDGQQHFYAVDFFGGAKGLKETQKRDSIKNEFCKKNNLNLIRISYKEINYIENKLNALI